MRLTLKKLKNININFNFGFIHFFYQISLCSFFGFLVVFLKNYGYSNTVTGIIVAMIILLRIIFQPIIGYISDKKKSVKNIIIISTGISAASSLIIPLYSQKLIVIIIVCIIYSIFSNPMIALVDSFTMLKQKEISALNYGIVRSAGSLSYSIAGYIIGCMIKNTDAKFIFFIYAISSILFIISCMFVNEKNMFSEEIKKSHVSFKEFKKHLLNNIPFIFLFIVSSVVFIPLLSINLYMPVILTSLGGNEADYGLSVLIMASSEIPVLIMSKRLLIKYKDTALIIIALFFCVFKSFLQSFAMSVDAQIYLQLLESVSYALFLPAALFFINRISPAKYISTYLTLFFSGFVGISFILASVAGGILIDSLGVFSMLKIFSIAALIALSVLILKYKEFLKT